MCYTGLVLIGLRGKETKASKRALKVQLSFENTGSHWVISHLSWSWIIFIIIFISLLIQIYQFVKIDILWWSMLLLTILNDFFLACQNYLKKLTKKIIYIFLIHLWFDLKCKLIVIHVQKVHERKFTLLFIWRFIWTNPGREPTDDKNISVWLGKRTI